jgi:hypothetical protein
VVVAVALAEAAQEQPDHPDKVMTVARPQRIRPVAQAVAVPEQLVLLPVLLQVTLVV